MRIKRPMPAVTMMTSKSRLATSRSMTMPLRCIKPYPASTAPVPPEAPPGAQSSGNGTTVATPLVKPEVYAPWAATHSCFSEPPIHNRHDRNDLRAGHQRSYSLQKNREGVRSLRKIQESFQVRMCMYLFIHACIYICITYIYVCVFACIMYVYVYLYLYVSMNVQWLNL